VEAIVGAIQFVINKIAAFGQFLLDVFTQVFEDLWEAITDLVVWMFDSDLGVVVSIVSAAGDIPGFDTVAGATSGWGTLPAEMLNMFGLLGIGYALGIIAAALSIRFMLGLIPFVRVGG
jgi:hypothetical protein